jgi:hypothetical protein
MRVAVLLFSLALSSCALYPTVPNDTPEELAERGRSSPFLYFDAADSRDMVRGLRMLLDEAAMKRRNADTVLREISFYGTLVLVGGTLEESIAARNIGAGSAGLAAAFSNHYGIKVQRAAFTRAARHARCIEDAIRPIAPEVRSLFDHSFDGNSEIAKRYDAIPIATLDAVNKIRANLAAELEGVTLAAPSVAEVSGIFGGLSAAAASANVQASRVAVGAQDLARLRAALPMALPGAPLDLRLASAEEVPGHAAQGRCTYNRLARVQSYKCAHTASTEGMHTSSIFSYACNDNSNSSIFHAPR